MKNPSPRKNVKTKPACHPERKAKLGVEGSLVALFLALLLVACGDGSGSTSKATDGREVGTLAEMGRCTSEREGDTVYVAEKLTDYLCKNKSWVDLSNISDSASDKTNASSGIEGPTSSPTGCEENSPKGFIREDISVTGVAQKGPFKFGSPLNLYELKNDLKPSGREYKDEISCNKGDFVIPTVTLAYPYAKLEVRGLYRNEVTGEWSTDSMTLRALTDFSEKRTEVNINLLTHLEYDRALYLVQNKGYSVYAAKKQAAQEIMTAFEFATAVTYSEDFAIFQNEGVSANTVAGNSSLLAISALVMGNRSDSEIQNFIDKFIADIKTDGEWNDLQTKATLADWAYDFNYSTIRASVKSWNILDIPAYETYLDIYWNNVYGLGGCSVNRKDVVAPNSNKLSKNYNKYFICNSAKWVDATTYQKDTYKWSAGKSGELKKGNVTDTIYVYNGTKWEVSERETAIGLCQNSTAGKVSKFADTYYICKNNAWGTATVLEYDTYGLTGVEGDVKAGVVNKDKYYVYENGAWRAAANDQEIALGVCTTAREGVVAENGGTYYICKSKTWTTATVLEYDTYGWKAGEEGEMRAGNVNIEECYEYKNDVWTPCLGSFLIDSRDSKVYKTVRIGTQTWMAENLDYADSITTPSLKRKSWCYENEPDSCVKYGRLYTWAAAIDSVRLYREHSIDCGYGKTCTLPAKVQGVCPDGWHLPTYTEWQALFTAVGGQSNARKVLKSQTGWYSNGSGTDAYGFSALPAGHRYDGDFYSAGYSADFWSATEYDSRYAYFMNPGYDDYGAGLYYNSKHFGFSVRCLQDSN